MKLCDRCPQAAGCLLDYLGPACQNVRAKECPEIQPNRAELFANMSIDAMAKEMVPAILYDLCEDGVPGDDMIKEWLSRSPSSDEEG